MQPHRRGSVTEETRGISGLSLLQREKGVTRSLAGLGGLQSSSARIFIFLPHFPMTQSKGGQDAESAPSGVLLALVAIFDTQPAFCFGTPLAFFSAYFSLANSIALFVLPSCSVDGSCARSYPL